MASTSTEIRKRGFFRFSHILLGASLVSHDDALNSVSDWLQHEVPFANQIKHNIWEPAIKRDFLFSPEIIIAKDKLKTFFF